MKWNYLRDLLAIVEKGSINAAAKHLGITQPSLSRSLRELEKEVGYPLLERQRTGTLLTPMGKVFARRAGVAMKELERARDEIEQLQGSVHGSVVACLSSMAHIALFQEAIGAFHARYPNVTLTIIEGTFAAVDARMRNGEIDFYIGPSPDGHAAPGLQSEKLFDTTRIVLGRKGHPLARAKSLSELTKVGWVITQASDRAEAAFERLFLDCGYEVPKVVVKCDTGLTWMTAVMGSDLLVLAPRQWLDSPFTQSFFEHITVQEDVRVGGLSMALIKRSAIPSTPAAEYFCDLLLRPAGRQQAVMPVVPQRSKG
jgi:LysR family transcriptional regulator of abg operon